MISEEEFNKIESRDERFEISMVYMMLQPWAEFGDLDLEKVKRIINAVKYVTECCDYNSIKEGGEYLNIKIADDARVGIENTLDRQKRDLFRRQDRGKVWKW